MKTNSNSENTNVFDAASQLMQAGIEPNSNRIVILNDLYCHRTHATIDEMYERVKQICPKVTKRTVYNTIDLLVAKGLVSRLTIDERCTHYDFDTEFHAHFLCTCCGKIFDVPMHECAHALPEGAEATEHHYFIYGKCKNCKNS